MSKSSKAKETHSQIIKKLERELEDELFALAERVNEMLKQEFLIERCRKFKELKRHISESIDIYNRY